MPKAFLIKKKHEAMLASQISGVKRPWLDEMELPEDLSRTSPALSVSPAPSDSCTVPDMSMPYDLSTKHRRIESPEPSTESSSSSISTPPPSTVPPMLASPEFLSRQFLPLPFHPAMPFYFTPLIPQTFTPQVITHHDIAVVPNWTSPIASQYTPVPQSPSPVPTPHEERCEDLCCSPKSQSSPVVTVTFTDGKKEFCCKYCDKSYVSMGALKMHIRTHTLPCKCDICGKAFSRPWLLQGHIRTHTGEKPFQCEHCNRAFADRSNLRAHLQTHQEIKKYSCNKCSKTFSRMSLLQKHQDSGACTQQMSAPSSPSSTSL